MAYTLHQPCTRFDLCEIIERATSAQMGMLMGQMAAGPSFVLRDGFGVAVAAGGYVEVSVGEWQAWFVVNRETGPRAMLAVIRAIALTLEAGAYPCVKIEVETPFGRRIARALGFERVEPCNASPEVWRHVASTRNVQKTQRRFRLGPTGSCGQPAPGTGANGATGC